MLQGQEFPADPLVAGLRTHNSRDCGLRTILLLPAPEGCTWKRIQGWNIPRGRRTRTSFLNCGMSPWAPACPQGSSESLSQLLLQFPAPSLPGSAVRAHLLQNSRALRLWNLKGWTLWKWFCLFGISNILLSKYSTSAGIHQLLIKIHQFLQEAWKSSYFLKTLGSALWNK